MVVGLHARVRPVATTPILVVRTVKEGLRTIEVEAANEVLSSISHPDPRALVVGSATTKAKKRSSLDPLTRTGSRRRQHGIPAITSVPLDRLLPPRTPRVG